MVVYYKIIKLVIMSIDYFVVYQHNYGNRIEILNGQFGCNFVIYFGFV